MQPVSAIRIERMLRYAVKHQLRAMSQLATATTATTSSTVTADLQRPQPVAKPAAAEIKPIQINKYMKYLTTDGAAGAVAKEGATKPLVVIYGWLMSKEKHYKRIHNFYLNRGFDVLKVQISPDMQLWPGSIKPVVHNMLDYVTEEHQAKPILLHGFSVGGYMYSDTIYTVIEKPRRYAEFADRIVGHVSDSPVDVWDAANGISKAVTNNVALQKVIERTLDAYLHIFKKQCTNYMLAASKIYHGNPLRIPTLYLYSPMDKISGLTPIYRAIDRAQRENIPHFTRVFPDTQHVEHLLRYPEIYKQVLQDFIQFIEIKDKDFSQLREQRKSLSAEDYEADIKKRVTMAAPFLS